MSCYDKKGIGIEIVKGKKKKQISQFMRYHTSLYIPNFLLFKNILISAKGKKCYCCDTKSSTTSHRKHNENITLAVY